MCCYGSAVWCSADGVVLSSAVQAGVVWSSVGCCMECGAGWCAMQGRVVLCGAVQCCVVGWGAVQCSADGVVSSGSVRSGVV